jgi:hypothetical protein
VVNINPIRLVRGGRDDTDKTGEGCIMNVIAYMQGERITDTPEGVCEALRILAIYVNDHCEDGERQTLLIPLVHRLMNTATANLSVVAKRFNAIWKLANELRRDCTMPMPHLHELMICGHATHSNMGAWLHQVAQELVYLASHARDGYATVKLAKLLDELCPKEDAAPQRVTFLAPRRASLAPPAEFYF